MKQSFKISIIILIIGFAMTFCSRPDQARRNPNQRIFPVQVASVIRGDIQQKIPYLGDLEALNEVKVYSTIPTKLIELRADVNDWVEKDQILAIVDNIKIKQGVLQAEAGLRSARAQYENVLTEWERIQKLYAENAVSRSQYDGVKAQKEAAEAAVNQAEAGLNTAREQLNDTYIKAPISGIVAVRNYDVGDQTSQQLPAFVIVAMDKIKITIDIVESQIALVRVGQSALINVDTYPDRIFHGKVKKVYPTVDPLTRTVKCEIILDNPDHLLKPGGFARVEIVTEEHKNTLLIPKNAIIEKTSLEYLGGEITHTRIKVDKFVFIVAGDSLALMRPIETDIISANRAEVVSGVQEGEQVITIGQYDLSDSSRVEIVERRTTI